jgi:hypothetical protein
MLQGKVHMAQFSVEIRHPVGSVLAEKQQFEGGAAGYWLVVGIEFLATLSDRQRLMAEAAH